MSTPVTPVTPEAATVAPAVQPAASAKSLTAIQIIEQDLENFAKQAQIAAKQAEQAIANTHAVQGAIQATQHLLQRLKAEAAKAEAAVKAEIEKL